MPSSKPPIPPVPATTTSQRMHDLPRPKRAAAQRAKVYLYQETLDWNEERALKRAIDASLEGFEGGGDATGGNEASQQQQQQQRFSSAISQEDDAPSAAAFDSSNNNNINNQSTSMANRNLSRSGRASAASSSTSKSSGGDKKHPNNNNNNNNNRRGKKLSDTSAAPTTASFKTSKLSESSDAVVVSSKLKSSGRNNGTTSRARSAKSSTATAVSKVSSKGAHCRGLSLTNTAAQDNLAQQKHSARPKKTLKSATTNNCKSSSHNAIPTNRVIGTNGRRQISPDESDSVGSSSSPSSECCSATSSSTTSSFSKGDHCANDNDNSKPIKQGSTNQTTTNNHHSQLKSSVSSSKSTTNKSTATTSQQAASPTASDSLSPGLVVNRAKFSAQRKFATSAGSLESLNISRAKSVRVPDTTTTAGRKNGSEPVADSNSRMGESASNNSVSRRAPKAPTQNGTLNNSSNSDQDLEDFELFPNTYINAVDFITFLIHTPTKLLLQPNVDTYVPFRPLKPSVLEDLERRLAKQKSKNSHINSVRSDHHSVANSASKDSNCPTTVPQVGPTLSTDADVVPLPKHEFVTPSLPVTPIKVVPSPTKPAMKQPDQQQPTLVPVPAIASESDSQLPNNNEDPVLNQNEPKSSPVEDSNEEEDSEEESSESSEDEISPVVTRSSSGGIRKRLRGFSNGQQQRGKTMSLRSTGRSSLQLPAARNHFASKRSMDRKAKPSLIIENFFSDSSEPEEDEVIELPNNNKDSKCSKNSSSASLPKNKGTTTKATITTRNLPKIGTRSSRQSSRDEANPSTSTSTGAPSSTTKRKYNSNSEEIRKSALKYEDRARKSIKEIEARYKLRLTGTRNDDASSDDEDDSKSVASLSTVSSSSSSSSSSTSSEPATRKTNVAPRSSALNCEFSSDDDVGGGDPRSTRSNPRKKTPSGTRARSSSINRRSNTGGARFASNRGSRTGSHFHYIETRSSRRKTRNSKSLHEQRNKELFQQYDDKENRFAAVVAGSQKMTRPTKSYRRPKAAKLTTVTSPNDCPRSSRRIRHSPKAHSCCSISIPNPVKPLSPVKKSSITPQPTAAAPQSPEPMETLVMGVSLHENRVPQSDLMASGPSSSSSSYGYGSSHSDHLDTEFDSPDYGTGLEGCYKLDANGDIDLAQSDPVQELLLTKNAGKFFALYDNYIIVGIDGYNAFWERVRKQYEEDDQPGKQQPTTSTTTTQKEVPSPKADSNGRHQAADDSFSSSDRLFGTVDSDQDTTDLSELI